MPNAMIIKYENNNDKILCHKLERMGYDVSNYIDIKDGINNIYKLRPSLIIFDRNINDSDCIRLIKTAKTDQNSNYRTKLLMVSDEVSPELVLFSMQNNIDQIIPRFMMGMIDSLLVLENQFN